METIIYPIQEDPSSAKPVMFVDNAKKLTSLVDNFRSIIKLIEQL